MSENRVPVCGLGKLGRHACIPQAKAVVKGSAVATLDRGRLKRESIT